MQGERAPDPLRPVTDLAGTPVADAGGLPIGALFGALAEAATGLIRYVDLALDEGRHVLVPVGHTRLLETPDGPSIRLRAAVRSDLDEIPTYAGPQTPFDDGWQDQLLAALGRCFHGERYYAHPAYDHGGLYAGPHPILTEVAPIDALRRASLAHPGEAVGAPIGRALLGLAGEPLGRVADVIVAAGAGARYVEVESPGGRRTLLPVGYVRAAGSGALLAPGLTAGDLAALPASAGVPDRDAEEALLAALGGRLGAERRYLRPDFLFHC